MLAVGLFVSVLYTAIMFFINHEVMNGVLWLIFGLLVVGEYLTSINHTLNATARLSIIYISGRKIFLLF